MPPVPAPPRPPADSQPETESPGPIAESTESPRVPILVAGVVMMFLLAVALLMVRSHLRGGGHDDSPNPNHVPDTDQTRSGAAPFAADSLGALEPLDGSASIPLNRNLLVSAEGLVIGRAVELCHIEIRDPGRIPTPCAVSTHSRKPLDRRSAFYGRDLRRRNFV